MIYTENVLVCIGLPLLAAIFFVRGSARGFAAAFLTGMCACLIAGYISGYINWVSGSEIGDTAVYVSPVVEETIKLLPLLFCMFVTGIDERPLLEAAVAVGAGFAIFENSTYLLEAGAEDLFFILTRGFSAGVMHIVSMILLYFGLMLMKKYRAVSVPSVLGALTISVTFHGLYNLLMSERGVSSRIGILLPIAVLFLCSRFMRGALPAEGQNN